MSNVVLNNSFKRVNQEDLRPGYASPSDQTSTDGPIQVSGSNETMSVQGSARAALVLFALLAVTGTWAWINFPNLSSGMQMAVLWGPLIVGLILVFTAAFKPHLARFLAPGYALAQGLFLGSISRIFEEAYAGIVVQAVLATSAIVFVMYTLYSTRILKVTPKFRKIVIGATLGIMVFYMLNFAMSFFGAQMPFIWDTGALGIGFSLFVIVIAASNLALDFDFIEKGTQAGLPKYMNWAAALGLLVTIIWIYIEVLRLLSKLRQ